MGSRFVHTRSVTGAVICSSALSQVLFCEDERDGSPSFEMAPGPRPCPVRSAIRRLGELRCRDSKSPLHEGMTLLHPAKVRVSRSSRGLSQTSSEQGRRGPAFIHHPRARHWGRYVTHAEAVDEKAFFLFVLLKSDA